MTHMYRFSVPLWYLLLLLQYTNTWSANPRGAAVDYVLLSLDTIDTALASPRYSLIFCPREETDRSKSATRRRFRV